MKTKSKFDADAVQIKWDIFIPHITTCEGLNLCSIVWW